MSTVLRTELSRKNKYFISKHRRLELVHFCLQYDEWDKALKMVKYYPSTDLDKVTPSNREVSDITAENAVRLEELKRNMRIVKDTCFETDIEICDWIFLGVTKGYSFTKLKTAYNLPCEKEMYYDRLKKFFYLLDKKR